jgi:ribokinase
MPVKPKILVVGSSNTDLVVFCDRLPKPGETVLGGEFKTFGGGKGANQAVAAARAGAQVTFLGAYGADSFGAAARDRLSKEGINLDYFHCVQNAPSGIALILVDGITRENLIAVAKSANEVVDSVMVSAARDAFVQADVVVSQLEVRDGAIEATARLCQELNRRFVLNPAPTRPLPKQVYESLYSIVVNEHEAHSLSGASSIEESVDWFLSRGCKIVVVTLGSEGALFSSGGTITRIPAPVVQAVDTTGAGDCFVGWFATGLAEGLSIEEAVRRGCQASALKVTRSGAQDGLPYREEVLAAARTSSRIANNR